MQQVCARPSSAARWPRLRPRVACPMAWCPPSTHLPARGRSGATRAPSDQTATLYYHTNNKLYIISGERGTVALRHEARCTCQCCPGLLSARPMGGRCLCCCGMPHGCDWPAPRRVSSARRSDSGQRNSPGLNAQPGAPARAGASHGACNASECSPRLAQMRPSSQPTVHRLLKKHSDECGTGDAWQAGHDAVIGCCVPSE